MAKPKAPFLTDAEIAAQADRLRADYFGSRGVDQSPRFPIRGLVLDFLTSRDHLDADLDADLGVNETGEKIAGLVTVAKTSGALKIDYAIAASPMLPFTLAHEVGHWVLHAAILRRQYEGQQANGQQPSLVTLRRDVGGGSRGDSLEWQANRFAVHLLLPHELVAGEFRKRYGTISRRHADQSTDFQSRWPKVREYSKFMATRGQSSSMTSLVDAFGVSLEALAIRLEELELV